VPAGLVPPFGVRLDLLVAQRPVLRDDELPELRGDDGGADREVAVPDLVDFPL